MDERMPLYLEVVDYEEKRSVELVEKPDGTKQFEANEQRAFLDLKMPNGEVFQAEIPPEKLDIILYTMFPQKYPER